MGSAHTNRSDAGADAPSLRTVATSAGIILGTLAVVMAAALVWSSARMGRAVEVVARDTKSQAIASELELSLLMYQRASNLYLLTGEQEPGETRTALSAEIGVLLDRLPTYSASAQELRMIDSVSAAVTTYIRDREHADTTALELGDAVRHTQPALNEAVATVESLTELNDNQVREAHADAALASRIADVVGAAAAGLIVAALVVVAWGGSRLLLRPLLDLRTTIRQIDEGNSDARVASGGFQEIADVARGFNAMADTLARQREAQLAFLAGVAHDLRNPLSALKIGIHALEIEESETRRARTRARLDRQFDRLARMIEDLLDATRIEAGQLELQFTEFDLRDVVEDMLRLYRPTSPDHEIRAELPPDPIMVRGDPLRVEQVVSNLLSNAVKYSPAGGRITVTVALEGESGLLSVADRGVGIPKDEVPGIFVPFRRRRPDVAPGAGLGLSVVRRIVEAHRGAIDVESEPGQGSTFIVRLPRAPKTGSPRASESPPQEWAVQARAGVFHCSVASSVSMGASVTSARCSAKKAASRA